MNGVHDTYKGDAFLSINLGLIEIILRRYDIFISLVKNFVTKKLLTVFVGQRKSWVDLKTIIIWCIILTSFYEVTSFEHLDQKSHDGSHILTSCVMKQFSLSISQTAMPPWGPSQLSLRSSCTTALLACKHMGDYKHRNQQFYHATTTALLACKHMGDYKHRNQQFYHATQESALLKDSTEVWSCKTL